MRSELHNSAFGACAPARVELCALHVLMSAHLACDGTQCGLVRAAARPAARRRVHCRAMTGREALAILAAGAAAGTLDRGVVVAVALLIRVL